jgi:hypothetical protein
MLGNSLSQRQVQYPHRNNWHILQPAGSLASNIYKLVGCDLSKSIGGNTSLDYTPTKYRHIMTI